MSDNTFTVSPDWELAKTLAEMIAAATPPAPSSTVIIDGLGSATTPKVLDASSSSIHFIDSSWSAGSKTRGDYATAVGGEDSGDQLMRKVFVHKASKPSTITANYAD